MRAPVRMRQTRRVVRRQLAIVAVKDFEHRIELAFSYLITVAFLARLDQIRHGAQALADDTFTVGELRQLGPEGNLWRKFGHRLNGRCRRPKRQAADAGDRTRGNEGLSSAVSCHAFRTRPFVRCELHPGLSRASFHRITIGEPPCPPEFGTFPASL